MNNQTTIKRLLQIKSNPFSDQRDAAEAIRRLDYCDSKEVIAAKQSLANENHSEFQRRFHRLLKS